MPWFNVDDGFAFHRKAVKAGNAALGLWTRAGSWCAQQLTDGFVPDEIVLVLGSVSQAGRLVSAALWMKVDGGYQFHEWSVDGRNPTKKDVMERRRKETERKQRLREKNTPNPEEPQVSGDCPTGTEASVPPGVPGGVRDSTPLPSLKEKEHPPSLRSGPPRKRGTRIPDDFAVTPAMVAWARDRVPLVDGRLETEKFMNYWQAATGKGSTKRDWVATWRNWMLNARERLPAGRASPANGYHSQTDQNIHAFLNKNKPDPPALQLIEGGTS